MASRTQGKLRSSRKLSPKEATGVQIGLEDLAEWCSWEINNISAVEKEKATGSNDGWSSIFVKCYL